MKFDERILSELKRFISFPTVSSNENNKQDILHCAQWLAKHLSSIGLQPRIYKTSSHPVVYAEYIINPKFQTILFYGHYDVQPVDPLYKWHTPPFDGTIKKDYLYGRGASDDKGQVFIHIKAVEKLLISDALSSVNIKFLIEGSEEIGSTGLKEFIVANRNLLSCNVAVVSDTKMASMNVPAITYSLRGSLNAEISIQTLKKELHSGTFGGCVANAGFVISDFIKKLYSENNSINIPGFYDDVKNVSKEERNFMKLNGPGKESLLHDAEIKHDWGEKNYTMHERTTIRPSLSITGITCGFQGKGLKNVIPSIASVKINFRLVPNQDPKKICFLFNNYLKTVMPFYATIRTAYGSFANPVIISRNNVYINASTKAYEAIFKQSVKFIRSGGTIAAVDHINTILNVPVILMGFAQLSDNMHAPNERMYLPNFFKGIETIVQFLKNIELLSRKKYTNAAINY